MNSLTSTWGHAPMENFGSAEQEIEVIDTREFNFKSSNCIEILYFPDPARVAS
jgi:hypothetical protein